METSDWVQLFQGAWTTLWISGTAILIGIPAGLVVALLRAARVPGLDVLLSCYVSVGRATSLVTLVLLIFFGAPAAGLDLSPWLAAIIALALNTTAFNAEIWRSALLSFPKEQLEAAQAGGMTRALTMRRIVLPQIATTGLPALVNEMSLLLKSSPAVAVIGVVDLTRVTNRIAAVTYEPLPSILGACVLYMVMVGAMVWLQRFADQRAKRLAM